MVRTFTSIIVLALSLSVSTVYGAIPQDEFNRVIDRINTHYNLNVIRLWESDTVNGEAYGKGEQNLTIKLHGGLARHKDMTRDSLALIVCHEIGHLKGGAPLKFKETPEYSPSIESQSDYFAALKCFRKFAEGDDHEKLLVNINVPPYVNDSCESAWRKTNEVALCKRTAMAGWAMMNVFKDLMSDKTILNFSTPDLTITERTYKYHADLQCRLDTIFQAALCPVSHKMNISDVDETKGVCHPDNGHNTGYRPSCWYK